MEITAHQLVYAYVEEEYSPRYLSGFQTLFYTLDALTEKDILEIESFLFYQTDKITNPEKFVFNETKSGKIVLARVISQEITDRFGRSGGSLGHALVLSKDEFLKIKGNPFLIFENFRFFNSLNEAIGLGDMKSANMPSVKIHISDDHHTWQTETKEFLEDCQFKLILKLFGMTERRDKADEVLCFLGRPESTYDLLRSIFTYLPVSIRLLSKFDTYFNEGTISRFSYLAVGLTGSYVPFSGAIVFDFNKNQFRGKVEISPVSAFARWWVWAVENIRPEYLSNYGDKSISLERYLNGPALRKDDISYQKFISGINDEYYESFFNINRDYFSKRILANIIEKTSTPVGQKLLPIAEEELFKKGKESVIELLTGFDYEKIISWAKSAYYEYKEPFSSEEIKGLSKIAESIPCVWLKLRCLRWSRAWDELKESLLSIDDKEYQEFARWSLGTVPIHVNWEFRTEKGGFMFGLSMREPKGKDEETINLISSLLGLNKERQCLKTVNVIKISQSKLLILTNLISQLKK